MKMSDPLILDSMSDGLICFGLEKKITYVNRAMKRLFGYGEAEAFDPISVQDLAARGLISANHAGLLEWAIAAKKERVTHYETVLRTLQGESLAVTIQVDTLRDQSGQAIGVVEVVRERSPGLRDAAKTAEPQKALHTIIGKSKKMLEILDLLPAVANSTSTVLLEGESGTGKELFARAIHRQGPRRDRPFIAVNCASLSEGLLESELFGHVKGAFTGAMYDRPGRFELADTGTLFLDEIGDMSPSAQAMLLRVLQEQTFERVGGTTTIKVDVRVVAATNKDLARAVQDGAFREDLYYRIRVFPIRIPPLRERRDDILPLIQHFIVLFNRETGKHITSISPKATDFLSTYAYQGNVRELENIIEHAFVCCPGGTILIEHLPKDLTARPPKDQASDRTSGALRPAGRHEVGMLAVQERDLILKTLEETRWNYAETAQRLGIGRSTLWRRLKHFDLKKPPHLPKKE